jgi:hypothetical protein
MTTGIGVIGFEEHLQMRGYVDFIDIEWEELK